MKESEIAKMGITFGKIPDTARDLTKKVQKKEEFLETVRDSC
jgi:hypothetical protein